MAVGHHHLHQHRTQALADAGGAGVDMHLAVVLHNQLAAAPVGKPHAHAGVLHGAGKAHRVAVFHRLVIVGLHRLQRLHQARFRPHDLAVGQYAAGADGVAVADLPGGDTHLVRHHVQKGLRGKAGLGHAEAPESPGRGIVGIIGVAGDLKILVGVGPRRMGAGPLQHRPAQGGKGAGIGNHAGLHALDDAVFVAAHGEVHPERMALGMDQNRLLPGQLHLHRHTGHVCDQRRVVLHRHVLLAAEAAAHQLVLHQAVVKVHPQHGGALVLGSVGALVGGQQLHAAVFQRQRHAAFRLQKGVLRPGRLKFLVNHVLAFRDGAVGVATGHMLVGLYVVLVSLKYQRRIGGHGLGGVVYGWQYLVFHLHQLLGLLQRLPVMGAHQSDGIAQIVGDLPYRNQRGLILLDMAHVILAGHILGRQHAHHAGQRLRLGSVDGQHPGPGIGGADGAAVAHAGHIDVVGVLAVALHLFRHVNAVDTAAHLVVVLRRPGQLALPEILGRQHNAVNDFHIAGAAADVVANGKAALVPGRVGIHVNE